MSIPESTLRVVLDAYGALPDAPVVPLQGATANLSFRVALKRGARVLRCCRRDPRPERLQFLADFQRSTRSLGLPVPRLYSTRAGQDVLVQDGLCWQMTEFVDGGLYDYRSIGHQDAAAECMGRLHAASNQIRLRSYSPCDQSVDEWWLCPEEILQATWRVVRSRRPGLSALTQAWEAFRSLARSIPGWMTMPEYWALPQTWTHGDFHGSNLRYRGERLVALLDFDSVDYRPRVYDLARALLMLARAGRGSYVLRPERVVRFLHVYQTQAAALSRLERKAIPVMMVISQLPEVGHLATLAACEGDVEEAVANWALAASTLRDQRSALLGWLGLDVP